MRKILCIVLTLVISSITLFSYAENVEELQTKSNEIQNQINQSNEILLNITGENPKYKSRKFTKINK